MNIKMAAQVIRDQVKMDDILALYGYRPRHGFLCCPFHGEKDPSLKVYKDTGGWHCFGCGRGGSVIDFVMEHENCDFSTAVRAIDNNLHMGLMDPRENPLTAMEEMRWQELLDGYMECFEEACDRMLRAAEVSQRVMLQAAKAAEAKPVQERTAQDWDCINSWKDNDQCEEDRKTLINELREEMAAWRRKARRTG